MAWVYLFFAGLLEIVWAAGLKVSNGFTKPLESAFTLAAMTASVVLLAIAAKTLPLGTAYAVWTGIGAVGAVLIGIIFFGESASVLRILCLALIIAGILGLNFSEKA